MPHRDIARNANCLICGFRLTDLDEECPRCASIARHLAHRRSAALEDIQVAQSMSASSLSALESRADLEPQPLPRGAVPAPPRGFKCAECGERFGPDHYMFYRDAATGASYGVGSSGRISPRYYFRRRRLCEACARYHDRYAGSGCCLGSVLSIACFLLAVFAALAQFARGPGS